MTVARIEIHFAWYFNHIGIFRVSPPLERKGLSIISVNEPDLCSEDSSCVLMRQMLGAFFQCEKTLLVAKLGALESGRERQRAAVKAGSPTASAKVKLRPLNISKA